MDLTIPELRQAFAVDEREPIVPVGGRTHWEVGGPPPSGVVVRAPAGVVAHDPADLTVTVGAGTTVAALDEVLATAGQHCPLDPRDPMATVGGVLACGLSGTRRLRYGPIRDQVLEIRFVTGDGRVVKGGGPTVKNVTGYDLPRLQIGALGTLGVLVQVTLRCRPAPPATIVGRARRAGPDVVTSLFRPSSIMWDGVDTWVTLEGEDADCAVEAHAAALDDVDAPAPLPTGAHRGRISVAPGAIEPLAAGLTRVDGARWLAEIGVGTVHVAGDDPSVLTGARRAAEQVGGWLLRESGGDPLDSGFGTAVPNPALHRRLKAAFDPHGRLNPGRLPL